MSVETRKYKLKESVGHKHIPTVAAKIERPSLHDHTLISVILIKTMSIIPTLVDK